MPSLPAPEPEAREWRARRREGASSEERRRRQRRRAHPERTRRSRVKRRTTVGFADRHGRPVRGRAARGGAHVRGRAARGGADGRRAATGDVLGQRRDCGHGLSDGPLRRLPAEHGRDDPSHSGARAERSVLQPDRLQLGSPEQGAARTADTAEHHGRRVQPARSGHAPVQNAGGGRQGRYVGDGLSVPARIHPLAAAAD